MRQGMIERSLWHPVASAPSLGETPLPVTLLDEPLVLWRDTSSAPHVFADRCPHRGARLSLGCVRGGELECAYHGWRFEGGGRAVAIPALPGFVPPPGHRATVHAVREHCGLLWVRLDAAAADDPGPPAFAALVWHRALVRPRRGLARRRRQCCRLVDGRHRRGRPTESQSSLSARAHTHRCVRVAGAIDESV